ncbi:MAG: hypothetical protein ABGW78_15965, partial [Pirellulales bacterium]
MSLGMHSGSLLAESRVLPTIPGSGITVDVEAWTGFDVSTMDGIDIGLIPITFTITNTSSATRTFIISQRSRSGSRAGSIPWTEIAVGKDNTTKTTLFVDPFNHERTYSYVTIEIRGYGMEQGTSNVQIQFTSATGVTPPKNGNPPWIAALSKKAFNAISQFRDQYSFVGNVLDMVNAPDEWRGWSAFSVMLLTESEWYAMSAVQKKAILDWVGLGGQVGLLTSDIRSQHLDSIGVPPSAQDGVSLIGAGTIEPLLLKDNKLPLAAYKKFIQPRQAQRFEDIKKYYVSNTSEPTWGATGFRALYDVFGPRTLPTTAILCFLVCFGCIAGPLNILFFARRGHRTRMFWTTPLISIAATLVLLGLMVFRDGVGGGGARRTLAILMPEQNSMAIIQEQFSRTGLLLNTAFAIEEPSWMRSLKPTPSGALLRERTDRLRDGDWFQPRTDQGYLIETIRPSRSRIEFISNGIDPPSVISSIEAVLDRVFIIDASGQYWTTASLGTGERKSLEQSDAKAFERWADKHQ